MRKVSIVALVALAHVFTGCSQNDFRAPISTPLAPSALPGPPAPAPISLIVFRDPATGFSTSDVNDVHGQIVRFNTADELIWVSGEMRFPEFLANGNLIGYHHRADTFFQIRFGTKEGRRAAFITWPGDRPNGSAPTILDLWVDERGDLKVADTDVLVPGP